MSAWVSHDKGCSLNAVSQGVVALAENCWLRDRGSRIPGSASAMPFPKESPVASGGFSGKGGFWLAERRILREPPILCSHGAVPWRGSAQVGAVPAQDGDGPGI